MTEGMRTVVIYPSDSATTKCQQTEATEPVHVEASCG